MSTEYRNQGDWSPCNLIMKITQGDPAVCVFRPAVSAALLVFDHFRLVIILYVDADRVGVAPFFLQEAGNLLGALGRAPLQPEKEQNTYRARLKCGPQVA